MEGTSSTEERSGSKMEYRRQEWKERRVQKRGVEGYRKTEERNGRNVEYRERSVRKMEHRREEWKEDRTQRREVSKEDGVKREEWKDNGRQRRGVEGRWSPEKKSGRKMEYRRED
jgi:hypothetical protein